MRSKVVLESLYMKNQFSSLPKKMSWELWRISCSKCNYFYARL